ncbi:hypothetical protein [Streptomyces sp. NPDC005283]|uniref:hypothetical protein n=1 Tax=Streptomyces sp. NPDC005283 TaxID=3156871 RepID=UPI0034544741
MSAPEDVISVSAPQPIDDEEDGAATVEVTLRPTEHPTLVATFGYLIRDARVVFPCRLHIGPAPDSPIGDWVRLGAGLIKDLPVARWERAARAAADAHVAGVKAWSWRAAEPGDTQLVAEDIVREMHPGIDPQSGKAAARRWNRLVRLAAVVQEHDAARARGAKSPAGEVAKIRGVEASTVRSWLSQAKQEGITAGTIPLDEFKRRFPGLIEHVVVHGDGSAEDNPAGPVDD